MILGNEPTHLLRVRREPPGLVSDEKDENELLGGSHGSDFVEAEHAAPGAARDALRERPSRPAPRRAPRK